jgi:hypothetical protein
VIAMQVADENVVDFAAFNPVMGKLLLRSLPTINQVHLILIGKCLRCRMPSKSGYG